MVIIFFICLIGLVYGLIEYSKIDVSTLFLEELIGDKSIPESIKDKSILFVSDFQFDLPFGFFNHKAAQKVLKTIESIDPDLLILGGDYIDGGNYSKDAIFNYLSKINRDSIAILGNHDYKYNMKDTTLNRVGKTSKVLVNESFEYHGLNFYGLDDYVGSPNLKPKLDTRKINIVLSHRPDAFYDFEDTFDFMLSGHTHGGMISLFGLYAPIPHNGYGQKLVSGLVKDGSKSVYVSRGVGGNVFGLPIRIFSKPEVILIKSKK